MSALPTFNHFPHLLGEWLKGQGPESDIVVSTRVRLARNLKDFPFAVKSTPQQREEVLALATGALERAHLEKSTVALKLTGMPEVCRDVLVERHLISRELANGDGPRAVVFGRGEMLSVMINEEDHLRLQWIKSGFDIDRAWRALIKVDKALERVLPYAFSEKYGYLTACPTNVGTGLRASVMLHLPALALVRSEIEKVFAAAQRTGLAVRGLYGEGSRAVGDFYQVSNQITLGRSETQLVSDLKSLAARILEYERQLRAILFEEQKAALHDRVSRSLGLLRTARAMPTEGALAHLSNVRLGVYLGLVRDLPLERLNALTVQVQKAHIQALSQATPSLELLETSERDRLRAAWLRQRLAEREP
jgi:protein arginine kinase